MVFSLRVFWQWKFIKPKKDSAVEFSMHLYRSRVYMVIKFKTFLAMATTFLVHLIKIHNTVLFTYAHDFFFMSLKHYFSNNKENKTSFIKLDFKLLCYESFQNPNLCNLRTEFTKWIFNFFFIAEVMFKSHKKVKPCDYYFL